jgi:HPt (histidine-containing phosphotransfer) domain-containing protein
MDPTITDPAALARLEEWGGPKLSSEIIRLFIKHGPERMDQIRSALTGSELDEAERGAHSLKSSAANVGAEEVRRIANDVEIASSEDELQRVRELVPNLEEAFTLALRELEMNVKEVK